MTKAPPRAILRAAIVLWAARIAFALCASYPLARTMAAIGAELRPEGDASLFTPGGFLLLDTLEIGTAPIRSAMKSAAQVSLVLSVLALFPLALAMGILVKRQTRWPDLFGEAMQWLPRFVLLSGATLLLQALAIAALALLRGLTPVSATDERLPALVTAGAVVVGGFLVIGLGLVRDLARAAVVLGTRQSVKADIRMAVGVFRKKPTAVMAGWSGPALIQVVLVTVGAILARWIDVAQPGAARIMAVAFVHQGVVLLCCALRSLWLSRSLDLMGSATPVAATDPVEPSSGSRAPLAS